MTELKAIKIKQLGLTALGKEPADLIINGGKVLNVYTGELLENQVVICGDRIAYVGPEAVFPAGPQTKTIDVHGQVIIPGFIDGHIHMEALMKVTEFIKLSLPCGTTSVITECTAPSNALGQEGFKLFVAMAHNQPQRFYFTAPTITYLCSNQGSGHKALQVKDMIDILDLPEVVGMGEVYWPSLVGDPDQGLYEIIEAALDRKKTVEGHGAGARNQKLAAMAAQGVGSCHEPVTAEEVRDRLRLGLTTMIREGSVRRELQEVLGPLIEMDLDLRRAVLVSDGVWPDSLLNDGHMDFIVQKAINLGLEPVKAIQMATLNTAEHFNLDHDLGGIAPGKLADMVVIPDLRTIKPQLVICGGRVVAKEGKLVAGLHEPDYPQEAYHCLNVPAATPGIFRIEAGSGSRAAVRVIELVTDIVNKEASITLPVENGVVITANEINVCKVAVIERYRGTGQRAVGLIRGYGLRHGAVASSFSFDEGNMVVIGTNDKDMAAAVNRLRELQGGLVFIQKGRAVKEIPLPIFGAVSEMDGLDVSEKFKDFVLSLQEAGCQGQNPLLTLFTIPFTVIPSIRLLIKGYWLSRERRVANVLIGMEP
ncbi:MAG: adenine deaminase [Dethiobacter sp.]|jgi:adenine deaminase|nr:adenine deaminase [Dethiobacter sp.]